MTYEQKVEKAATQILSGMLANPSFSDMSLDTLVQRAIDAAELLVEKLEEI
jgi:hypothetical protein